MSRAVGAMERQLIKDAGRKCFAISYMEDPVMISGLINRLKTI